MNLSNYLTGWKLDLNTRKAITFTDKNNIGRVKLVGTYDLHFYPIELIKRVRLIRRADGYFGLSTAGHSGTWLKDSLNALGEDTATFSEAILSKQVTSVNKESPVTA